MQNDDVYRPEAESLKPTKATKNNKTNNNNNGD